MWRIPAFLSIFGVTACSAIIEREQFEGGSSKAASSSGSSISTASGAGGAGGAPVCLNALFHVNFDDTDTSSWLGPTSIFQDKDSNGMQVSSPFRLGGGAWLADTPGNESVLKNTYAQDDHEYWFGFSQLYATHPNAQGTSVLRVGCVLPDGMAPFSEPIFDLRYDADNINKVSPFHVALNDQSAFVKLDSMSLIPNPKSDEFIDWAVHFIPSYTNGLVEVYANRIKHFSYVGPTLYDTCPTNHPNSAIDAGISRFGANSEWSIVEDEMTLVEGNVREEDALFTLTPPDQGAPGCF